MQPQQVESCFPILLRTTVEFSSLCLHLFFKLLLMFELILKKITDLVLRVFQPLLLNFSTALHCQK